MTLPLVPLKIPNEWEVEHNIFTEVCPERFNNDDYEYRWEFNEDILQIRNTYKRRILDLGWYPEFNPLGQYCFVLVEIEDNEMQLVCWDQPIIKYYPRNIEDIKNKIEELLEKVTEGQL